MLLRDYTKCIFILNRASWKWFFLIFDFFFYNLTVYSKANIISILLLLAFVFELHVEQFTFLENNSRVFRYFSGCRLPIAAAQIIDIKYLFFVGYLN